MNATTTPGAGGKPGPAGTPAARGRLELAVRWVIFLALLYLFLVAIQLFGSAFKMLGRAQAEQLFTGLQNPFAGLSVGVLATVLMQSSSVTTSLIVGLVGEGQVSVEVAVPMVMGANIGTTITNTLVSMGSVTRSAEFRRAFAGATAHDFFNFLTVLIVLPIELATGFLRSAATWLATVLPVGGGGKFDSPLKTAVKWLSKKIEHFLSDGLGLEGNWLAATLIVLAVVMIMVALTMITKNMKFLMANRIERGLNRVLSRSGLLGLLVGALITIAVQSSSITTSLLVPMFAAGVLTLEAGFPIMIGANIGTTVTALLAALVVGQAGLVIALVHLLFNFCGTLIFFPLRAVRIIPIRCAERLADLAMQNRLWVLAYVVVAFVLLPLAGIAIWK